MKRAMMHKADELSFLLYWKLQVGKKKILELWKDEDGIGSVELVLILVVLVGIVAIFKEKLQQLVNSIFSKISTNANSL